MNRESTSALDDGAGKAVKFFQRALEREPNSPEVLTNLGLAHVILGNIQSATECLRRALLLDAESAQAHFGLGLVSFLRREPEDALVKFRRSLSIDPESSHVRFHLGVAHLLLGEFTNGLPYYEERYNSDVMLKREFPQPRWHGEPLAGERILLYAEQGLGDTLQFVRYVPMVAARGGRVVLEVQPKLRALLAELLGVEQIITTGETVSDIAWQCPLPSMPFACGTELATIPAEIPYLKAESARVRKWRELLNGSSFNVGLVWAGNPGRTGNGRFRSVPPEALRGLSHASSIALFSLQKGTGEDQVEKIRSLIPLRELPAPFDDFADMAAAIMALDLVITVDTSVAHLAGGLGRHVWILLPFVPDWRWMLHREDSPWYPTARLFRQSSPGSWETVIATVADALEMASRSKPLQAVSAAAHFSHYAT